jgi:hypothetical protein
MSTTRPPRHEWDVASEVRNWVPVMVEDTFKSHVERSELDMGWFNTFEHMERGVSRTVSASCREGDETLRDQARQLYLFGSTKVAVISTKALYVYGISFSYYNGGEPFSSSTHQFSGMCRV